MAKLSPIRNCSRPGCKNETLRKRKFCPEHKGHRDHLVKPAEQRFWRYVTKTDSCWLWWGSGGVYGVFNFGNGHSNGAHKFSYLVHWGPVPEGYEVNHRCHNKRCVNPDHLELNDKNENGAYRKGPTVLSRSGIRNVFWWEHKQRWVGRIRYRGKDYSTGCKHTAEEAETAVKALRLQVFGVADFDPSLYV